MFRKIGMYKKWYSLMMVIVMLATMIMPLAATATQGDLVTLAKWDFNASAASPTGGILAGSASNVTINGAVLSTYQAGVSGGADKAINANTWPAGGGTGGGYWLASFVTTGYSAITLSSKQLGSNTGPKDFKVQYSLNGTTGWTDIPGGSYSVANDWTTGVINNLQLPSETANQPAVYIRWLNTSTASINGGTVAAAGTDRIDDIIITATEGLPTPAPALAGFNWAQGSASGTTVATTVPSGTLKYTVGAGGSQTQPNVGDTVTSNTYGPTVGTDIPVTAGQHIFITRIDAQNKVTDWADVTVLDTNIKPATAPPADALIGFTWAKGNANGTTQATVVPGGTLKYVVGAAGAHTRPYQGDPATAYTLNLAAATDIAVTSGQHIFIVKLDAQSKITDWADVTVLDADIKPIPLKTTNPVANSITFSTLTTVSGSAGAVTANSTVSLYLDSTSPTPVMTTTAAANGSFSMTFTNADSVKKVYITAKDGSNTESDKVAVDLLVISKIKDLRVNDAAGVNTLASPVNSNMLYTIEGVATIKNNVIGSTNNNYYIQDDTSGVNIYSGTAPGFQIDPGVKVRVTGYLQFYLGLLEFTPTATVNLGTAPVPAPLVTDIVDLTTYATGEPLEGKLVTVTGKVASAVASGANYNVTLVDANNKSVIVRVIYAASPTLGAGINVATDLLVGSTYTVTGVVGQNKSATPFTSGYQIFPRSKSDVVGVLSFAHEPITQVYKDVDLAFTATAQNAQSVDFYYRAKGDTNFTKIAMISTDNANFTANIAKESVPVVGFEYYIEAKAGTQVQSSGDSGYPNQVAVIVDTDGPAYSKMIPTQGQKTESKLPDISLTLSDPSGVDKSSVVVKMDGTTIPSQYVSIVGTDVSVALQADLSVGTHTVFVSSKDLRGNASSVSWSFEVILPFTGGNHYRGTTHNHTNISHDAAGDPEKALLEAEKYHYDWFAFSDHSHDIDASLASSDNVINKGGMTERTGGSDWQLTQKLAKDYTKNDKFVVFPAFEMTSTTWGHSNVFGTTNFIDRVVNGGAYQNLNNYYAWVMTYDDIVAQFNHPAMSANAFDNFIPYDKNVDKLFTMLEVGNGSGHYGYANAQDKFFNALDLGWHVAPTYGEDNHDATWGQTMKRTVIVAKDLSQDSLLSSMKNMHVYFTEDPNMTLDFSANGYYMGSILDRQSLDFHITGSDNVAESPTNPDYKFLSKDYKSNDNIAKVELITNGGRVVQTYIPPTDSTSFTWDPKINVVGAQQWFVVKVTQKDGEQAYSAPIWTKEVNPDVRLSGIEVVGDAITGGSPATIKALVSNLGKTVASNLNVHLYYNQADADHKIGDYTIADLAAKTMGYATFNWNNPISGDITFIAVVDPPLGDDTKDNTFEKPFKIKPPLGITVMLDGAHGNENSSGDSGTYKDNFKTMIKILQTEGYTFVENKVPITPAVLTGVKVLMISHPKTALTTSEQTAVADFVKAGGSLLLTEKSNNSADPTINNPILQAIGSDIRVNNDGVFDDSKDGNFWGDPKVSPYAVKAYPEPVGNYITDIVRTIEYYSGSSLFKADGTKLTDSSKVTLLVKGNKTTYQSNLKGGAVTYNTDTNSNNGAQIPLIASEQIGLGRIVVSGMNIFNDKQQDTTFNYKGNPRFTLNVYNWLAGRDTVVSKIGDVRNLPDEKDAVIEGTVTSAAGVFYDAVYIQDDTGGIMAFNQIPDGSLKLGDKVRVYGHSKTFENNKELEFGEFLDSFIKLNKTPGTPIAPKVASTKDSTSEMNQGLLVKVEGKVLSIEDGGLSFIIDDGSGPVLVFTDGYIATQSGPAPNVKVGDTLQAVGLAGKYSAGTRIRVRDTKELVVTSVAETVAVSGVTLAPATLTLSVGGSQTLTATVAPVTATNQAVTWASNNASVATVDNTGKVTAIGAGTATITVTTADGNKTATSVVTVTAAVVQVSGVTLAPATLTLSVGGSQTLTATVAPVTATNQAVTWASNNASVATVDNTGKVTAIGAGTATITVTTADGNKTATSVVTVTAAVVQVSGVTLAPATLTLIVGGTQTLTATVAPATATNQAVTWTSNNASVATVDNTGKLTAVGTGTATITVTTADGNKTATSVVTVTAAVVQVSGVTVAPATLELIVGGTQTLTATVAPATATNQAVTWTSNNASVATVDNTGKVTAVGAGTATITVTTADGNKTATSVVTVTAAVVQVSGVTVAPATLELIVGGTQTLTATVAPATATNQAVTWTSNNASVATVDNTGKVTAIGAGTATITVTTADGNKTATAVVTVNASPVPISGVTLDRTTVSLTVGGTQTLAATLEPANATNKEVTWASENTNVAKVDSDGKVTAIAVGTTKITVTTVDGSYKATVDVTVTAASTHTDNSDGNSTGTIPDVNKDKPGQVTVPADTIKNSANGKSTVDVPATTTVIKLPSNTAALLGQNQLEIKTDKLTVDIPSDLIKQLTSGLSADALKNSAVSLDFVPLSASDAKEAIAKGQVASQTQIKLAGDVYEFKLSVTNADGSTAAVLSKFDQPITLHFKVDASVNPKLAGVYYMADDGKLEYIGGKYTNGEMIAQINHFSKYAVLEVTKTFSDVPSSHWAVDVIKELAAKQIVNGTSVTTFEPSRNVTRAEFTSLLVRALKLTATGQLSFTDVKSNDWYSEAVSIAVKAGIVNGKSETAFDPTAQITREEMVAMVMRAYGKGNGNQAANNGTASFSDETLISSWAVPFVNQAAALHFVEGRAAGVFEPQGITSRAEAAQVIYNLLNK